MYRWKWYFKRFASAIFLFTPLFRSLDVCGCKNITDGGVRSLSSNCKNISYLDLSSTAITYKR